MGHREFGCPRCGGPLTLTTKAWIHTEISPQTGQLGETKMQDSNDGIDSRLLCRQCRVTYGYTCDEKVVRGKLLTIYCADSNDVQTPWPEYHPT